MKQLSDRTIANMESVLEETCRGFPNGGDHELRRYIAEKLKASAGNGSSTLGEFRAIAHNALNEISKLRTHH
jgi:hypothetical protein